MIEVFKTNVNGASQARTLIGRIHNTFSNYKANFDLNDCDKILRVTCTTGTIRPGLLISLLKDWGCDAEILADDLSLVGPTNSKLVENLQAVAEVKET